MKKLLGVALMLALCASSAFALAAPKRVQGLRFGTWTPQGFVAEADTTFLNGASANTATATFEDTTDAFVTANCDWGAMGYDPNNQHPVFRVWISGSFVSVDTAVVTCELSWDKLNWLSSGAAASYGVGGETKQAIVTPFYWTGTVANVSAASSGNALVIAPYARFIIKADGNTAARQAALRCHVSYRDVRDSPGIAPQMVVRRIQWGSFSANGFNAVKDTSSITFSAPDTTQWIDGSEVASGPANIAGLVADSTQAFGNIALIFSDPSTADSVYIQQETSATKAEVAKVELKASTVFGMYCGAPGAAFVNLATGTSPGSMYIHNFGGNHPVTARPGDAELAPYLRWIIRGGNGGEVLGGTYGWITYFRVPRK